MKKIYDHFRVVKITMIIMILIVMILTIISNFIGSIYLLYFNLGSLITSVIAFVVIQLTYSHNLKVKRGK